MKNSILVLAMALSTFCFAQSNEVAFTKISGTIENVQQTEMLVMGTVEGKRKIKRIPVNADGTFSDTLQISEGKFTLFVNGPKLSKIKMSGDTVPRKEVFGLKAYLKAGSETRFDFNAADFYETLKVSGDYMAYSIYNHNKQVLINALNSREDSKKLYLLDANSYKNKMKNIKEENDVLLAGSNIEVNGFKEEESLQINYEYLYKLSVYEAYHASYIENKEFKVNENFLSDLDNISYDNGASFKKSSTYQRLVWFNLERQSKKMAQREGIPLEIAGLRFIGTIKDEWLKNTLLKFRGRSGISKTDNITEFYNEFLKWSTDKKNNDIITDMYNKILVLAKGSPSPKFQNYENYAGGTTSLDDLKGKYVYIDVWATWCGPCKAEIPHLQRVEKEFHDQNIAFVSISVDKQKDREKWLNMVKNKELGGIQLIADNDSKSQFYKDYAIKGIPRFILLDPKGNIVNADALRPSNPKLVELFKEMGI